MSEDKQPNEDENFDPEQLPGDDAGLPNDQADHVAPEDLMQTFEGDLPVEPVADDEKGTVDEIDAAPLSSEADNATTLDGDDAGATIDGDTMLPDNTGTLDDVTLPDESPLGTIDDVTLPGADQTLDDVTLPETDQAAGEQGAEAQDAGSTLDDVTLPPSSDTVDEAIDGSDSDDGPAVDSVSSINQTLDSVDLPPGATIPPVAEPEEPAPPRFDQTLDSVDQLPDSVSQTLDSTELPDAGVITPAINQTVDSAEFESGVIDQLQSAQSDDASGLPTQTLDSVDLPTAPLIDPGTDPQRAEQRTVDSAEFDAKPPVLDSAITGGGIEDSHPGSTLDSAMVSAEHIQHTWEGVSGEHVAPETSIRAEVIEAQESDNSLFIQTRAFHDPKRGGAAHADYEIDKVLGEGGMGVVYMARQASISRTVAVKMLKGKTAKDETQRNKFLSEAVVTGDLEHPNIVPIYDLGVNDEGALFYSMKRVQGTPWMDVIGEKSDEENIDILMKVADAIAFAHDRKVIHRDLKPENVMLGGFGEVLVMDWGLAVPSDGRRFGGIKQSVSMGGTPAYMAPEMAAGPFEKIGLASDIYLLGAMLYEIITGRPPHTGKDVMKCLFAAAKNEIQPTSKKGELVDIALKAMSTNPADRYETVADFQTAIRQYLSHSESIALSNRAEEDLLKARQTQDYEDYARARFGFAEAYELWPGNRPAREGYQQSSLEYAATAHTKGDFDLGLQLLEENAAGHDEVREKITLAQKERAARQQRLRTLRVASLAGLALFLLVVCGFSLALWSWMSEAQIARADAEIEKERAVNALTETERQRKLALAAKQTAESEKAKADKSAQEAIAAREVAEEQRQKATKSAIEANMARQTAEREKIKADKSAEEALAAKQAAEIEKRKADKSAEEALAAKMVAEEQKVKADRSAELALKAQRAAEIEKTKADRAAEEAIAARKVSEEAKEAALSAEKVAQQQRVRAVAAADEARRQGYVATIGLAAAKIEENAFESAEELLLSLDPSLQKWEWGRLMFLCKQGIAAVSADRRIDAVAFEPAESGRMPAHFVAGGWGGIANIWSSTSTSQPRHVLDTGGQFVYAVAYSPDGQLIATGSDNAEGYVMVWDASTGQRVATITGHEARVTSVEFSADGKSILTGSADRTARIFDIESGRETAKFLGHLMGVWQATFSPDNRQVATASEDGSALVWDVASGNASPRFQSHQGPVYAVAFSQDGSQVVTAGADKRVLMWQPGQLVEFDFDNAIQKFARRGAAAAQKDTTNYKEMGQSKADQHAGAVRSVKFSRDGSVLVSSGHDNTVKLWTPDGKLVKTLRGHGSWVRSSDVSADGKLVLSGGYDETQQIRLWDVDKYVQQGQVLAGHDSEILAASFSQDGEQVLTASRDRTVKSWDFASGLPQLTFTEGHKYLASRARFLPGDKQLITAAVDNTARIWDVSKGAQIGEFAGTGLNAAFAISTDGKQLMTGSEGSDLKLWDIASRKLIARLEGHQREVTVIAFSRDGKMLISGDAGGQCLLWDVATRKILFKLNGHTGRINDALFLPGGDQVLTASSDRTVSVWETDSGREVKTRVMSHPRGVRAMDVTPDGERLLTASEDGQIRFWEIASRRKIWEKSLAGSGATIAANIQQRMNSRGLSATQLRAASGLTPEQMAALLNPATEANEASLRAVSRTLNATIASLTAMSVNSIAISNSGNQALVAGKLDKTVRLIDVATGRELMTTAADGTQQHFINVGVRRELAAAAYSNDGLKVVTVGGEEAAVWSRTTGGELMSFNAHGPVLAAKFDSNRKYLVTASTDNSARIWDAKTGKDQQKLVGHGGSVNSAMFAPDDSTVLTASNDGTAILWSPEDGRQLKVFKPEGAGAMTSAVFAADGATILTASADGAARTWDVATGKLLKTYTGVHKDGLLNAAFSRDNQMIVTASRDNTAVVWDAETAKPMQTLAGHTAAITAAVFSPGGQRVLTSSEDYTAKLWDVAKGKEILTLKGHTREVTSVTFSRDGQYALTGSKDGTARVWLALPWGGKAGALASGGKQGEAIALQTQ